MKMTCIIFVQPGGASTSWTWKMWGRGVIVTSHWGYATSDSAYRSAKRVAKKLGITLKECHRAS